MTHSLSDQGLLFLEFLSQLETFNVSPNQGSVGIQILEVSIARLLRHLRVETLVRHEVGVDIRVLGVVPDLLHLLLAGHEEEPAVNLLRRRAGGRLVKAGKHLTAWGDNWIHHSGNYLIKPADSHLAITIKAFIQMIEAEWED